MARHLILSATPVADLPGGPDLPGSVGGLGYSYDLRVPAPDAIRLETIAAHSPSARIAETEAPIPVPCIKRTLLFAVRPDAPPASVADLEAELLAMPTHILAIRAWSLSRVEHGEWTHAWEQMFATVDGLLVDYLTHPYHWTRVDTWFDPQNPRAIVDPALVHIYREADPTTLEP